jgi:hypothetical protein
MIPPHVVELDRSEPAGRLSPITPCAVEDYYQDAEKVDSLKSKLEQRNPNRNDD